MNLDLGLRNGRVIHPSRTVDHGADVREVAGRLVTPGFIDLHTHAGSWDDLAETGCRDNTDRLGGSPRAMAV